MAESSAKVATSGRTTDETTIAVKEGANLSSHGGGTGSSDAGPEAKEKAPMAPHSAMFRYADGVDKMLAFIGIIGGIGGGSMMPLFSIVFGELLDTFDPRNDSDFMSLIEEFSLYITLVGVGGFVVSWMEMGAFMISAERQVKKLRTHYFRSVLRQEVAWFDEQEATELVTKMADDARAVKGGLGEKAGMFVRFEAMFVIGFVIGFIYSWELTLVILTMVPMLAISGALMMHWMSYIKNEGAKSYAKAGGVAEEHIAAIRTVQMFSGEGRVVEQYSESLAEGAKSAAKKGLVQGGGAGVTMLIMFSAYGLAFWFGSKLIADDREVVMDSLVDASCPVQMPYDVATVCQAGYEEQMLQSELSTGVRSTCVGICTDEFLPCILGDTCNTGGTIVLVFFAVIMGAFAIGQAQPSAEAFAGGRAAIRKVNNVVDRKPVIDASKSGGQTPAEVRGDIRFTDVEFTYPTRPDAPVLQGLDLDIRAGTTVALVGASGCGKSTCIQLLERFYDPDAGSVSLDGVPLNELNLKWLRSKIGLVAQEPVVFAASIEENIAFGHPDPSSVTTAQVIAAAKVANAHSFIKEFPSQYGTFVGEGGASLSGGQKQRIAIARAVLRDPAILLLDEATSALDNESEKAVQDALDRLVQGRSRTTIVIAHRLSTVRDADVLVVLSHGKVVEQGTHDELMALGGHYRTLVEAQESGTVLVEEPGVDEPVPLEESTSPKARTRTMSGSSDGRRGSRSRTLSFVKTEGGEIGDDEEADPMDDFECDSSAKRLLKMNAPEWPWLALGMFGAILNGAQMPAFAIIFTEMVSLFFVTDIQTMRDDGVFWGLMFVILAVVSCIAILAQMLGFEIAGERLVKKVRDLSFRNLVHMPITYFDREKNSTGAITTRLSEEAALIRGLAGERIGIVIQNFITCAVGLGIALVADWKLTLVVLSCMPIVAISGAIQMQIFTGAERAGAKELEKAGHIVAESVSGVRTVQAFGLEDTLATKYGGMLEKPYENARKGGHIAGIGFGMSNFIMMGTYGLAFYVGGLWVEDGDLTFNSLMRVLMALMMAAMAAGQNSALMPDVAKAKKAAVGLFKVVDYAPDIDSQRKGTVLPSVEGSIHFDNLHFNYPTRKSVKVLDGFTLDIKAGQTVALVGRSGCGKSTIISMLMQLYRPSAGTITLDGVPLNDLDIKWLRSKIGIVSQEPTLIGGRGATESTVRDCIVYGMPRDAPVLDEHVVAAAKAANAHDFIMGFPDGYDTIVGAGGTQLSGGQKQRIAIARAIIREPSILLLDEATSALDTESERIVQAALDEIIGAKKRTTIVIAHRLSTIINSDVIVVVDKGKVIETGTHEELLSRGGAYSDQWHRRQGGVGGGAAATS